MTRRLSTTIGPSLSIINRLVEAEDAPIGQRLRSLHLLHDAVVHAERQLTMQLGADVAKHLIQRGVQPSGRRIGETAEGEASDE